MVKGTPFLSLATRLYFITKLESSHTLLGGFAVVGELFCFLVGVFRFSVLTNLLFEKKTNDSGMLRRLALEVAKRTRRLYMGCLYFVFSFTKRSFATLLE